MDKKRWTVVGVAAILATATGTVLVSRLVDTASEPSPSKAEQAALDWVLIGTRTSDPPPQPKQTTASDDVFRHPPRYRGPFPDQGMPEDARPLYVVFDPDDEDLFYVVFEESDPLYTAKYQPRAGAADPKLVDFRFGYGWFDLSRPQRGLKIWKLKDGQRWSLHPADRGVPLTVGASFDIDTYNTHPSTESEDRRHMYVDASGSNAGDAAGKAECYLIWGSQSALIDGPYLEHTIEAGDTLVASGNVRFPKRLDDWESGDVECEAQARS